MSNNRIVYKIPTLKNKHLLIYCLKYLILKSIIYIFAPENLTCLFCVMKEAFVTTAQSLFDEGYACSQAVLLAYADHFDLDKNTAKRISSTFGGGMGRLRETCGAVTGGFMVLGLAFGNEAPKDMDTKLNSYKKVRELNKLVIDIHGTSNCRQLLIKHANEQQVKDRKHHKLICRKVVGDTAGLVFDILRDNEEI